MKVWGQLERAQLEDLSADPSQGVRGRIWFNSTNKDIAWDDGTIVRKLLSLNNNIYLLGRNAAGSANINLIKVDASDNVAVGPNADHTISSGGLHTLTGTVAGTAIKDEDNMASDSASHLATQQSIKAYVDNNIVAGSNFVYSAQAGDYLILDGDGFRTIGVTTAGTNRTVTLPTAADNTNRIITVKKVDSGTGTVIIDGEGSETIDGSLTYTLLTEDEGLTVQCDGTEWHVLDFFPGKWTAWTPTYTASGSMTYTSVTTRVARYRKVGRQIEFYFHATGTTGVSGSQSIFATLPLASTTIAGTTRFSYASNVVNSGGSISAGASFTDATSNSDKVEVRRADASAWTLGAGVEIAASGNYQID